VAVDFVADAPTAELKQEGDDFVIPTTEGGGFAGLTSSATDLLGKVNTIPFDSIGRNLDGILRSVNDVAKGPELKASLTELAATLASAQDLLRHLDTNVSPASKRLPEISVEL